MTGAWEPPDTLDPEVAYLVRQLRELKDRSGVSLGRLAAETPYSKSSWARYLRGATLPPRQAVRDLARITGEPAPRLLALWERAEANWSGRAAGTEPRAAGTGTRDRESGPRPGGSEARAADTEPRAIGAGTRGSGSGTRPGGSGAPVGGAAAKGVGAPLAGRRRRGWLRIALFAGAVPAAAALLILPFTLRRGAPAPRPTVPGYPIGCRGASCVGKSAQAMDCGLDGFSFAGLQVGATYLELRISDQCSAAWAKVSHAALGDVVSVVDRDGHAEPLRVSDPATTRQFLSTGMIVADRHSRVRACLLRAGERRCTSWGGDSRVPPPTPDNTVAPSRG